MLLHHSFKLKILLPFLNKIELSSEMGESIFVAGQIKVFLLDRKRVLSFPIKNKEMENFLRSKKFMKKIAKNGFCPFIFKINESLPSSEEEFITECQKEKKGLIFRRLYSLYKFNGIKEISSKNFINKLIKKDKDKKFKGILGGLRNCKERRLKTTTVHGDFSKEQILKKDKEILFIDFNPKKGLILEDIIHYFREEKDLINNKEFIKITKEVFGIKDKEEIKVYIALNEISIILEQGIFYPLSLERIKNLNLTSIQKKS